MQIKLSKPTEPSVLIGAVPHNGKVYDAHISQAYGHIWVEDAEGKAASVPLAEVLHLLAAAAEEARKCDELLR